MPRPALAPVVLAPPEAGDFYCVPISGKVGLGVQIGQWLAGDRFQPYDHAAIYAGQPDKAGPHGYSISAYPDHRDRLPLPCPPAELPGSLWSSGLIALTPVQRQAILRWADLHKTVSYSFLDYAALALRALHAHDPGLQRFIADTGHMICSQFVDAACSSAGVHLFSDGRWPGDVMPSDLAMLLQRLLAAR
jgi:hypothetical protein